MKATSPKITFWKEWLSMYSYLVQWHWDVRYKAALILWFSLWFFCNIIHFVIFSKSCCAMSALQHGNSPTEETGRFQSRTDGALHNTVAASCGEHANYCPSAAQYYSAVNVSFHGYIHGLIVRWIAVGVHHHPLWLSGAKKVAAKVSLGSLLWSSLRRTWRSM